MNLLSRLFSKEREADKNQERIEVNLSDHFEQPTKEELDWLAGQEVTLCTQFGELKGKISSGNFSEDLGYSFYAFSEDKKRTITYTSFLPRDIENPSKILPTSRIYKISDGKFFIDGPLCMATSTRKNPYFNDGVESYLVQQVLDLQTA